MMPEPVKQVRRWDAVVRMTHWAIVAGVVTNGLFLASGSQAHIWVGYALGAVLGLRLIWGLAGPERARFGAFPPSLAAAVAHIQDIAAGRHVEHTSHNPLGALMVYAIWFTLSVIVATGVGLAWSAQERGGSSTPPVASATVPVTQGDDARDEETGQRDRDEEDQEEGALTEIHEIAVNLLYALIVLHLAGVFFETRRSGPQIVKSMLP